MLVSWHPVVASRALRFAALLCALLRGRELQLDWGTVCSITTPTSKGGAQEHARALAEEGLA